MEQPVSLQRKGAQILAITPDHPDGAAVRLVYSRPLSQRGKGISFLDSENKKELFWLDSISDLSPESQALAEQALDDRYRIAVIESVTDSEVNHGHRYLKVVTSRGPRYFNLREPGKNVTHITEDHLVIRDSMGNRYEVPSLAALDENSRDLLDRVL